MFVSLIVAKWDICILVSHDYNIFQSCKLYELIGLPWRQSITCIIHDIPFTRKGCTAQPAVLYSESVIHVSDKSTHSEFLGGQSDNECTSTCIQ